MTAVFKGFDKEKVVKQKLKIFLIILETFISLAANTKHHYHGKNIVN